MIEKSQDKEYMGYKRFGCIEKEYKVSHLLFLLVHLFLLVVQAEKE